MHPAAIPINEGARLLALASYRILDTPEEEGFDDLTVLAAALMGTPTALVSLVDDDRQWFKSHHGTTVTETPRELAFCAHAILGTEPMVVNDAAADARFADNPLVTGGPKIRFYAGAPLINPEGFALGTLCVLDQWPRSITAAELDLLTRLGRQVVALLELRRTRDAALGAAAAKADFLSTMSHEIRTPLNGLLGMTEALLDTHLNAEQRDLLGIAKGCGEHLLHVVNDVLDYSRLELNQIALERAPLDLVDLTSAALRMFERQASANHVTLRSEFLPSPPAARMGDPLRIRQVLINLVGNAVKFTANGSVTVRLEAPADDDWVVGTVSDTGIGIDSAMLPGLFVRFSQSDPSTTRRFGGSGLGLAITRRLVELMGGTIQVQSTVGVGTSFRFRVPLPRIDLAAPSSGSGTATVDPGGAGSASDASLKGLKVLVAEDNAVNRLVVVRFLERLGCRITAVENGRLAVDAWRTQRFDAVLMDCQMPEMDGFEATRSIRATSTGRDVAIIALTASAMPADRERCVLAGMSDFLSKPLVLAELEAALQRVLRSPSR